MIKTHALELVDHLTRAQNNGLVDVTLDRVAHRRDDAAWIERCLHRSTNTRVMPVWRQKNLIDMKRRRAVALLPKQIARGKIPLERTVLMGCDERHTYFALRCEAESDPLADFPRVDDALFEDLRKVGPVLADWDASLLAYAKGMCYWHERHRYCGVCGSATINAKAGHLRICNAPGCAAVHFPRTDPAIIVLVHSDDQCLLGRQSRWPKDVYSTLAGFVEPGESAEQAVVREVVEETGVRIDRLFYHSSQPWPFPSSLMLGFHAQAAWQPIGGNDRELEDARWFTREPLSRAMAGHGPLRLPPAFSISRKLMEDWCRRKHP